MDSSKKWRAQMERAGKVAVTVYIDQDLRIALNDKAKAHRWTMTEAYENAIRAFLSQPQEPSQSLFDALQEPPAHDDAITARLEAMEERVSKIADLDAQVSNILKSIEILNSSRLPSTPVLEAPQEQPAALQEPSKNLDQSELVEHIDAVAGAEIGILENALKELQERLTPNNSQYNEKDRVMVQAGFKRLKMAGYTSEAIASVLNNLDFRRSRGGNAPWKPDTVTRMAKKAK